MVHGVHEEAQPPGAVEEVVLQVRIAVDDPDVAQHLVEHARRSPGAPFVAQILERAPGVLPKEAHDDLAIGEGRVVVGDFPQARVHLDLKTANG
jgi:hypothetical protein